MSSNSKAYDIFNWSYDNAMHNSDSTWDYQAALGDTLEEKLYSLCLMLQHIENGMDGGRPIGRIIVASSLYETIEWCGERMKRSWKIVLDNSMPTNQVLIDNLISYRRLNVANFFF